LLSGIVPACEPIHTKRGADRQHCAAREQHHELCVRRPRARSAVRDVSSIGLDPEQRAKQPLAGSLFEITPGVRGLAPALFGG
jgi:hypothetical protein